MVLNFWRFIQEMHQLLGGMGTGLVSVPISCDMTFAITKLFHSPVPPLKLSELCILVLLHVIELLLYLKMVV